MPAYTPQEVYQFWIDQGGDDATGVLMVAVAYAESGLRSDIPNQSGPICCFGMWQENEDHWGSDGYLMNANNWQSVSVQAYDAIILSSNGTNVAAWDTCYAPGQVPNYNGILNYPQVGSAAYNALSIVEPQITPAGGQGTLPPSGGLGQPPPPPAGQQNPTVYLIPTDLATAWSIVADWINSGAADVLNFYQTLAAWVSANVAP